MMRIVTNESPTRISRELGVDYSGGRGDRSVSYPFFSGYERDEAFPQDTDLSPVLLSITISVGGEVPRLI